MAVVGGSSNGFGTVMTGVRAIDFSAKGTVVTGTMNTISPAPNGLLADIATSPFGDIGAIDENGYYYQQSSLIGGWAAQKLDVGSTPFADLAMDSLGRPHVVGGYCSSAGQLITSDFNVSTGMWTHQNLCSTSLVTAGATIAADSRGGVGAAWVQTNPTTGGYALEYAYNDGENGWAIHTVTNSVFDSLSSSYVPLRQQTRVGLAFDANDFPVISFVAGSGSIYLAYDPVTAVPEPSTLALLAVGGAVAVFALRKSRGRRS